MVLLGAVAPKAEAEGFPLRDPGSKNGDGVATEPIMAAEPVLPEEIEDVTDLES